MLAMRFADDGMTTRRYIGFLRKLNGHNVVGRIAVQQRREVQGGYVRTLCIPSIQTTYDADWIAIPF